MSNIIDKRQNLPTPYTKSIATARLSAHCEGVGKV